MPRLLHESGRKWTHEHGSMAMMDYLFEMPQVRSGFTDWGFDEKDFRFIKSLIGCSPDEVSGICYLVGIHLCFYFTR